MFGSYSKLAGGDIRPSRFVVLTTATLPQVGTGAVAVQAGAGDAPWGISQPSTRSAVLVGWDDGLAAKAGENVNIYGPGDDECLLEIAADVAAGGEIKPDALGRGIPAASDKDRVGAIAVLNGKAGDLLKVKPVRYDKSV